MQSSYTYNLFDKSLIGYADYSQIHQNGNNTSNQYGGGFRYNILYSSWLGLDYTNKNTKIDDFSSDEKYLSISYVIYV